jgi:hypothetical protein
MGYLRIELARTIDEDRFRDAEHCHRIDEALAARQKPPTNMVQILVQWLQSLVKRGQRTATEQRTRALAELS